jgi:copper chaperone CopZ
MKRLIYPVIVFILSIQLNVLAQTGNDTNTETLEFMVYGNCGMCKSRIEKALKVDGIESATWDIDSKIAKVVFNPEKISEDKIHKLVSEVGHDTEKVLAKKETYDKLHTCCMYERKDIKVDSKNVK